MNYTNSNILDGVMVSVLASSVVDHEFEPRYSQTNIKLVFAASPLSMTH